MENLVRTLKQPRAIETRDRILREAARLFAIKGFHDTKVDEIIKAAEVTKGAFFHHFQGKEELGFAVIDRHMEDRREKLDRIEDRLSGGSGSIRSNTYFAVWTPYARWSPGAARGRAAVSSAT